MIPPPLRCIQRNAEACGAARMDRSEGAEPKGREADLFQARDGGKPRVAQPPQQDRPKCEDRHAGEITTERMPANQEAAKRILFGGEVVGVIDPAARPIRSMTARNAQASSIFEGQAHLVSLLRTPICGTFVLFCPIEATILDLQQKRNKVSQKALCLLFSREK